MNPADIVYGLFTSLPFLFPQKDPTEQSEPQYDEFGFRVDAEGKLVSQHCCSARSESVVE